MVVVQRASFHPKLEHIPRVRAELEAGIRRLQEAGVRGALHQTIFGPKVPTFYLLLSFESLDGMEQYRREQTVSAGITAELVASLVPFIEPGGTNALAEIVVPNPNPYPSPGWILRIVTKPLPDKGTELTALTSEWAQTRGSQGFSWSLAREMVGPNAGTLITNVLFERLDEWEKLLVRGRSEEAAQQYLRDITPLQSALPTIELLQVLVPTQLA